MPAYQHFSRFELPRFELQGHRGARGLFAENTLEGFLAALDYGLDSFELDIAITADGVAVVVHDPCLNPDLTRGPDGAWLSPPGPAVHSLTLAELRHYDVGRARPGSDKALAHPLQRSFDGAVIPTLAELIEATRASGIRLDVELKTDPQQPALTVLPAEMAEIAVRTATQGGALERLAIRSFDWRGLAYLRAHHPHVPLAWLTGPRQDHTTPATVAEASASSRYRPTWAPLHTTLDQAMLDDAHTRGLRVVPWTVNDPADAARLIALGVDGLCTDRPDLIRRPVAD